MDVLADAHAPEDDRRPRLRVGARDLADRRRVDAADRGHLLGREIDDVPLQLLVILGIAGDILLVGQALGDDRVEHRVEQRNVGAGLEGEMLPGEARKALPARVDHDEAGAALLDGVLDEGRGDRMIDGRIGADDDDDLRVERGAEGRRHRPRIQSLHQRGDRRGVAQARAMIDVVGAEAGAHQLLEEIRLLVRALGGAEAGERPAARARRGSASGRRRRDPAPRPSSPRGNASNGLAGST